jgi:hypothetical protein
VNPAPLLRIEDFLDFQIKPDPVPPNFQGGYMTWDPVNGVRVF